MLKWKLLSIPIALLFFIILLTLFLAARSGEPFIFALPFPVIIAVVLAVIFRRHTFVKQRPEFSNP